MAKQAKSNIASRRALTHAAPSPGEDGMKRIAAIGAWAREIGPWRLGFGLLALGGAYARIGMALGGDFSSAVPGRGFVAELAMMVGMVGSAVSLLLPPRTVGPLGVVHPL